ncbi:hypothetical protein KPHVMX_250364 [Klebsiella pneumoniae]|nr:hypothetical protein KPHVMX_250364 [Klebsiella pneumoniae]
MRVIEILPDYLIEIVASYVVDAFHFYFFSLKLLPN